MDVLPDEQETLIRETAREFFAAESTPALIRACEKDADKYSPELWQKLAGLGWLGVSLPDECGGQGLPITYAGLLLEEAGRHIAPIPLHSTLVASLVLARHGTPQQRDGLRKVIAGETVLCFAVQGRDGAWSDSPRGLSGTRGGGTIMLEGERSFVDNFRIAHQCLVLFTLDGQPAAALVDTKLPGIERMDLVTTAKDSQSLVTFSGVRIPERDIVPGGAALARYLCDCATALMTSQLAGCARRDMEFAAEYARQREAFGQPIGSFQAIQHLMADMLIAVDGVELLVHEALWRLDQGLGASIEVSQAKAFASDKCIFVGRSAQQIHGGLGFMMEYDLQLWYRRIVAFSLRCGSVREHRQRIAAALIDQPGKVRLGMSLSAQAA